MFTKTDAEEQIRQAHMLKELAKIQHGKGLLTDEQLEEIVHDSEDYIDAMNELLIANGYNPLTIAVTKTVEVTS